MKLGLCWAHMTLYWAYLGPIWHSTCARWAGRKELDRALKEAAEHEAVDKADVEPILSSDGAILGLYCAYMLAPCWAHVTDPFSPPYEILAIFKNHGKTLYMTLYWASLGPLFNVYLPMLGPCWPYITPCRAHLGSIGRYVRTMLGLCWTQNTP